MLEKKTNVGYDIGKINRLAGRLMNRLLIEEDVQAFNSEQGRILHVLWENDGISQSELSKKTGLALNTLTKMLDKMCMMDLIRCIPDREDKRKKRIVLTENAKRYRASYDDLSHQMTTYFYEGFSIEEREQLEAYLRRIVVNLEKHGGRKL